MKDLNSPMRPVLYLTKEFGFSRKKKKSKVLEEKVNQGQFQRLTQVCKMCQEE